jgi:hypothetical protein
MTQDLPNRLPDDFGEGWMSNNARDLCKIATVWGGFERAELVRRIVLRPRDHERRVNTHTVEAVLRDMLDEQRAEEGSDV